MADDPKPAGREEDSEFFDLFPDRSVPHSSHGKELGNKPEHGTKPPSSRLISLPNPNSIFECARSFGPDLPPDPPYFIGPLICKGDAVLVVGKPGVGKSMWMADILCRLAAAQQYGGALAGEWTLDRSQLRGRIKIFNAETSDETAWNRMVLKTLEAMGIEPHSEEGSLLLRMFSWSDVSDTEFQRLEGASLTAYAEAVADELANRNFDLVVIDPLFAMFGAGENADNSWVFNGMVPFMKRLRHHRITSFLLTHPPGQAEANNASLDQQFSPYGSKQQVALVDVHIGLKRNADDKIVVRKLKSRRADWITRQDTLELEKGDIASYRNSSGSKGLWLHDRPAERLLPKKLVAYLRKELGHWDIGDWYRRPADLPKNTFFRNLEVLVSLGLAQERRAQDRGAPLEYSLTSKVRQYRPPGRKMDPEPMRTEPNEATLPNEEDE